MTIASLDYRHQAPVTGEFRVRRLEQKTAPQGEQYLAFAIEDCTGELRMQLPGTTTLPMQ